MENHLAAPAVPFSDDMRFREQIVGLKAVTAACCRRLKTDPLRGHVPLQN